jgi:hypothetical protein
MEWMGNESYTSALSYLGTRWEWSVAWSGHLALRKEPVVLTGLDGLSLVYVYAQYW